MPLYDFRCDEGHRFERFVKLENFADPQNCSCGAAAERVISAPMFTVDNTGYNCPITGKWIGSKKAHEDNLKRHDCRVLETGEKDANEAKRAAQERAFDKAIEDSVEKELSTWDSAKMETLSNELVNGKVEAVVERA